MDGRFPEPLATHRTSKTGQGGIALTFRNDCRERLQMIPPDSSPYRETSRGESFSARMLGVPGRPTTDGAGARATRVGCHSAAQRYDKPER